LSGLPISLITAGFLALVFVALSLNVSRLRGKTKVGLGSGVDASVALGAEHSASPLLIAIRSHANFAEYVPISLILLGLLEFSGADQRMMIGLSAALVLSRLMIPFGMGRPAPNLLRAGGMTIQWLMISVAAVYGVWLVLLR
jgi:uncharacterized membrane protein YecN with MAPEG domain